MPNKDINHDMVVRALIKAGWKILDEQHYLSIGTSALDRRRLFIDIKAQHQTRQIVVLVEVKNMLNSMVHELMEMIGQYVVYRAALDYLDDKTPLYIAMPEHAYKEIILHPLGQQSVEATQIQIMVYNHQKEEIIGWIPPL
ncbi:MAG: element excision factor XisH family protein [bacterium]|nr:element excision factor XisH family protein [bacterium]